MQKGAEVWLKETGCKFDMVLDPERKVIQRQEIVVSFDLFDLNRVHL